MTSADSAPERAHDVLASRAPENVAVASERRGVGARDLLVALGLGAAGLPGLLPGASGEPDPLAATTWVALIAPAAGYAAAVLRLRPWPIAPVVPVVWVLLIALADAASRRDLPAPAWGALPILGTFGIGMGLGHLARTPTWRGAALVWLATTALAALSLAGLVTRRALPPQLAARALDVSPVTLAAECAGVDWMRHPPVYEGSSTVDIDPSVRTPYDGRLAGVVVFVVGCAAASIRRRAKTRDASA